MRRKIDKIDLSYSSVASCNCLINIKRMKNHRLGTSFQFRTIHYVDCIIQRITIGFLLLVKCKVHLYQKVYFS